jgi:hypothetical protein
MDTHKSTLKEFFLLLSASLAPIFFCSAGLKLQDNSISFFQSILIIFLKDSVFAYTATMIATFFVLLYKRESRLQFTWIFMILSIGVWSFSSFIFFNDKSSTVINTTDSFQISNFRNISSLTCYFLSLIIWYYAIYIGYKPIESAEENLSKNRKKLMDTADKVE